MGTNTTEVNYSYKHRRLTSVRSAGGTPGAGLDSSKLLQSHKGVGILVGADDGELSESGAQMVRTHLLDLPALVSVCERGRQLRLKSGLLTGTAAGEQLAEPETSNLVEDVAECFMATDSKLWSETIIDRLAKAKPNVYDGWSPTDLANHLKTYNIDTKQVWGQTPQGEGANRRGITRDDITTALSTQLDRRSTNKSNNNTSKEDQ